jgi:AcrR family transcriptional regulator
MTAESDLRQKVLKASLALIGEGGLDGLSMREAARKAGVSHQAPYYYFGDKEAILAALAGEGFAKLGQALTRAAADAGDPGHAVVAMGKAYVDFAIRHPAYFQLMFRADAVPLERHSEARLQEEAAFDALVDGIDQAFAELPSEERRKIAVAAWAMVHGLATLILEGSLARKVGVPKGQQRHLANEVIETFASLMGRREA